MKFGRNTTFKSMDTEFTAKLSEVMLNYGYYLHISLVSCLTCIRHAIESGRTVKEATDIFINEVATLEMIATALGYVDEEQFNSWKENVLEKKLAELKQSGAAEPRIRYMKASLILAEVLRWLRNQGTENLDLDLAIKAELLEKEPPEEEND